ncbi:MAG: glycoside hydrolase family 16 protein [Nocardioidaceae bacterium]|nr:glycoside hydrolase family 16 protein [Nocardioidaceae bacterium]MCL2613399.1 glycoside hydrolase family 16 protein [Nocardioidaceae bacterium]
MRRRGAIRLPRRLIVALSTLPLLAVLVTPAPGDGASPSAPRCGSSTTLVADGVTWTCSFDDEFNGSTVGSGWSPLTTLESSWTTQDTCYLDRPRNVYVSDGSLRLVARRESKSFACRAGARATYSTRHSGGGVTTAGKFTQTFGRFEFRAKFPATRQAGFWGNLWIYPAKPTYGAWPASGEIDIAEHWSGDGDGVHPTLHYTGSGKADTSSSCTVHDVSAFHTYALDWMRSSLSFYYDGRLCFRRPWSTFLGSAVKPFNRPFYLILSEGYGDISKPISAKLPSTGPMAVSWVRVYH